MTAVVALLKRYSYPLLGILLLLFFALFYTIQGMESKQHIRYLKELRQLEHDELRYNMELFRARFNLNSDFDQLLNIERSIDQLLATLKTPPTYIDEVFQLGIQNLVSELESQYHTKSGLTSQFKTAKALYSNSARYLPQLHLEVEALSKIHRSQLVDQVHYLAEEILTHIANQHGNHEAVFLKQIHYFKSQLDLEFDDQAAGKPLLHALLRHMELIVSNLPSMSNHLNSASSAVSTSTMTHLREIYLSGYKRQQSRIQLATQLLGLFTLALFTALLFAVINLRRTQEKLEQSNLQLESRVIERTAELASAKAYAENITASMSEALLVVDCDGNLLSCNSAAETLTGYSEEQLHATKLGQYLAEPILEAEYQSGEGALQQASGKQIPVQLSRSSLLDMNGTVSGYIFVIHDLTERKHAEEQRQFLAFQSGVAEMGITVMHNIGNIITGVIGNLQQSSKINQTLLKAGQTLSLFSRQIHDGVNDPQRSEQSLTTLLERSETILEKSATLIESNHEKLEQQLQQINESTQQVGALIKLHEQDAQPDMMEASFDLHALVEDLLSRSRPLLQQHHIATEVDIPDELPLITLPRNQLMQMVIHLLENGVDAIVTRNHSKSDTVTGKITLSAEQTSDNRWCITIGDNGCGIPQEQQRDIFKLGFSTQQKTGYGLHSVGTFVQSRNGSVQVESEGENRGSRFTTCFPL